VTRRYVVGPIVLIKADGMHMQEVLFRRLSKTRYKVRPVSTSMEVLEYLDEHLPVEALIWAIEGSKDEVMQLLDQLRDRESDLCVILIGPELGAECVSQCLRNGAFDYLAVPVRPGRIEESLRQGLDIRHSFRKVQSLSGQLSTANEALGRERDRLKCLNQSLVLLNQLGHAMSATHEAEEIVRIVAQRVPAILPYDVLTVAWREPEHSWVYRADELTPRPPQRKHDAQSIRQTSAAHPERLSPGRKSHAGDAGIDSIEVPLLSRNEDVGSFRLERVQGHLFGPADREFMITVATSLALSLTNAHAHRSLEQMAMKDGLTDLFNRRAFDQLLDQEIKAAERYRSPLCLLLGDVDHFKAVNDHFGHPVGDALLKEVATLLTESLREVDIVARYGGEEFAIILPRTDGASGVVLANRIRERIERHVFVIERFTIRLTLSLGVAGFFPPWMSTRDDMVDAVDRVLYQAKAGGRNRVAVQEQAAPVALTSPIYVQP
jgi:diguanylate cyclase (GGDEF)-like protein